MSLEAALAENTATMKTLIAVLQSGAIAAGADAGVDAAGTTTAKRGRKAAADTPPPPPSGASAVLNDGKSLSVKLRQGDPEGTRYFHIAAHNTVAVVKPGDVVPSITGTLEIGGDEYDSLKAKYSAPVPPSSAAAATGAAAAAPASTPAASTASNAASSGSPTSTGAVDGPALLEKCKALHGHLGNDALASLLKKHVTEANGFDKATVAAPKVPTLIGKAELHAAAAADIDKLMKLEKGSKVDAIEAALAPAAAAADNANLFG